MNREIIQTELAPAAIGPYAQAVTAGNMIFTSGQIPLDPATGAMVGTDITEQTVRVCENLRAVLDAAGSSPELAVKTTCYLTSMDNFAAFNAVYAKYFSTTPARSCVAVKELPKGALVEVEVIAVKA